jgi:hypothetical protein
MKKLLLALCFLAIPGTLAAGALVWNVDHVDAGAYAEKGIITLYVDYLDDHGVPVEPLPDPDKLEVYANGDLVRGRFELIRFREVSEALAVGILIGAQPNFVSPINAETGGVSVFDLEKTGAKTLLNMLRKGTNDWAGMWAYYATPLLDDVVPLSSNITQAADAVDPYRPRETKPQEGVDGTAAPPSFYKHLKKCVIDKMGKDGLPRRKALVVVSDGHDVDEGEPGKIQKMINKVIDEAKQAGLRVYSVGYSPDTQQYLSDLARLPAGTGGRARLVETDSRGNPEVAEAFQAVGDELMKQMVVRFTPEDLDGGRSYKFKLRLKDPDSSSEFPTDVPLDKRPLRIGAILKWVGIVAGALVGVLLLVWLVVALVRWRRNRPVAVESDEPTGPVKGKLVCTNGSHAGDTFWLTQDVTSIGSMSGNVFQLQDGAVSKRHCAIRVDDMRYELADLGSTNGTFVNSMKITKSFLKDGDEIRIGGCTFTFHLK